MKVGEGSSKSENKSEIENKNQKKNPLVNLAKVQEQLQKLQEIVTRSIKKKQKDSYEEEVFNPMILKFGRNMHLF